MKALMFLSVFLSPLLCGSQNLIQNSSFEFNSLPTGEGWFSSQNPIPQEYYENDAPEGGGLWSLKLNTWGRSLYFAETFLTNFSGQKIFKLDGWMKTTGYYGVISLCHISSGKIIKEKIIMEKPTSWTKYEIVDTLNLQPQDTIKVRVSSTYSPVMKYYQLFDLIELRNLSDTLSIEYLKEIRRISILPNPLNSEALVLLEGAYDGPLQFFLSSITGKLLIPSTSINDRNFVLSRGNLSNGLYILTIMNGKQILANKKVIVN